MQQYHVGALRNNNTRMRQRLGPDTGFDSIGDFEQGRSLARFLDRLDETDQLAKTILYNLNPADNELMATMIGNFQDGSVPGKMQCGSAWWFLDQLDGMEAQMRVLANMGLLSRFVGMITDSRSFLSYSRHEYFRRLLCNILGEDVRRGRLPDDRKALGQPRRERVLLQRARLLRLRPRPGRGRARAARPGALEADRHRMSPESTRAPFSLDGRVALVTGASRGLGAAIAVGLAEAGADVGRAREHPVARGDVRAGPGPGPAGPAARRRHGRPRGARAGWWPRRSRAWAGSTSW